MSNESAKIAKDLESILNELDSANIEDLTEAELLEYRAALNPYGRVIEGSDNYLNFSYTNLSEKYNEKLITTAMVGYLNTACDEWHVPEGFPAIPVYDYVKNPSLIDEFSKDWTMTDKHKRDIALNKQWMAKRVIVKEFLEEMFSYNPNTHIRSSYKPNPKDIARGIVDTPAANLAIEELKKKDPKFSEQMLMFDRVQKMINMRETSADQQSQPLDKAMNMLTAKKIVMPEYHYATVEYGKMPTEDLNLLKHACEMIPPVDTFGKFRNYLELNYDKLREAVQYLYCEKPDLDIAICPHSWHNDLEEAESYVKKHRGEVIADVITAHSGKWNFHGPFAKVRESMKFYNDNTEILEEIAGQIEKDAKMGGELMKNRIKQQKKKNVEEDGPDAELFTEWRKNNSDLKDMNGYSLEDEDAKIINGAPDDAIAVKVFRIGESGKLQSDHFYTKAEAPTDLPGAPQ